MTHIGTHLSISKGIENAIYVAIDHGANALQICVSPMQGSSPGKAIPDPEGLKDIIKSTGIYLVIHGKYILNFCRTDLKWQHDALIADLRKANQLGPKIGVVIHQGKNVKSLKLSREQALQNYIDGVKKVLDATSDIENPIVLENSCQQGTELGYTLEELAIIYNALKTEKKYKSRIKFCLDTCHIFVAGTLQMKDAADVDQFFHKFDKLIGLESLEVIHFNDSKTKFNGHNDHHDNIGEGYIGDPHMGGNHEGMKRVVAWAKQYNIPLILETPSAKGVIEGDSESIESIEKQLKLVNEWSDEAPKVGQPSKPKLSFKKK